MNKKLLTKSTVVALVGLFTAPAMADVSISGWINQAVVYSDNGQRSEVASIADNGTTLGSRITFAGSSDLPGGYTAGFDLTLEPLNTGAPNLGFGSVQCGPNPADCGDTTGDILNVLGHSVNFAGGFGKITMGLQSMPTDNIAVLEDPSLTLWASISPVFRGNNIGIVSGGAQTGATYGSLLNCRAVPNLGIGIDCNGIYRQGVRYDLPTFIDGLGIAAGWANDDVYDVALKYKTAFGRVNTQVAFGYARNNGPAPASAPASLPYNKVDNMQVQAGFMDNAGTGLFYSIAYQREDVDLVGTPIGLEEKTNAYWMKGGIKRAFTTLGDTSIAFQYGSYDDQFSPTLAAAGVTGSTLKRYGGEINQYFGSSFMLYASYELLTPEAEGTSATALAINSGEDLKTFSFGAVLFF